MRTITERELCNKSAAVMGAVERGEPIRVTRSGVVVAELRPAPPNPQVEMASVLGRFRGLFPVDLDALRRKADALFGPDELPGLDHDSR